MSERDSEQIQGHELAEKLRERIRTNGPLTLHDYMQTCLMDPALGYYQQRDPFGAAGDFITAPEICQIFGELLGLWGVHVWAELGQPANTKLVELGPGRGALMSDALRAASLAPAFLDNIEVHFVETSAKLRKAQEQRITDDAREHGRKLPTLFWHDRLEDVPDGPTLLIANEFLDALPIRQFQRAGETWHERLVGLDGEGFVFTRADNPLDDAALLPAHHIEAGDGEIVEICPVLEPLVKVVAARAEDQPLAGLFVDYGYAKAAPGETFQAVKSHAFADPLQQPGMADLTAHVDFERLAQLATHRGLTAHGPATQRDFLLALGARERAAQLMENMPSIQGAHQFITGLQRLIEPDQMGHLFKVTALTGSNQPVVPGFETMLKSGSEE